MNGLTYPIHLRREFERRWAARMVRDSTRQSPPVRTDTSVCGAMVIAPSSSTFSEAASARQDVTIDKFARPLKSRLRKISHLRKSRR